MKRRRNVSILPRDYFNTGNALHYSLRKAAIKAKLADHDIETHALDAVSKTFGVSIDDILGRTRVRRIAEARHAYFSIMRNVSRMSFVDIGSIMDRDHSTVIHSCNTVSNLLETDWTFKELYTLAIDEMRDDIKKEHQNHESV